MGAEWDIQTIGLNFFWLEHTVCVRADGLAAFRGFFCCGIILTLGYIFAERRSHLMTQNWLHVAWG